MRNSQRGSALFMVILLLSIVSLSLVGANIISSGNMDNSQLLWSRKKTFYVAEGLRHATITITREYFAQTIVPDPTTLKTSIETKLTTLIQASYPEFSIENSETHEAGKIFLEWQAPTGEAPIPNGPYMGMSSPQFLIHVRFNVNRSGESLNAAMSRVDMTLNLAQISLSQFYKFFADLATSVVANKTEERGHIHVNGDYCFGATNVGTYIDRITVSGRLMHANDSRCPAANQSGTDATLAFIATDSTFTNFHQLTNDADNGCTNCGGTGMAWAAYSMSVFGGRALDQANMVEPLILPNAQSAKLQMTWSQTQNSAKPPSSKMMRFIVDPVQADDAPTLGEQKLANRADLRIVDGVWYIKDPDQPSAWPGLPIWSDHPGSFADASGNKVGQDDIRTLWTLRGKPWAATMPKGFSYYEYDSTNHSVVNDNQGVVSYGSLAKTATGYVPGFWLDDTAPTDSKPLCGGTAPMTSACTDAAGDGHCGVQNAFTPLTCASGNNPQVSTLLLKGTRSGFINGFYQANSAGTVAEKTARGRILPLNFDVSQLQVALQNANPGELGSYFPGGVFNGIVYVSFTWKGNAKDFTASATPSFWPAQGAVDDLQQMAVTSTSEQRALPFPLCSALSTTLIGGRAGEAFDQDATGAHRFVIPDCAQYESDANPTLPLKAFINAVRIVNGANISHTVLPKGISIVTNLPVYLTGDFNTSSDSTTATSAPWVQTMVAGDKIYQVSNNWLDERSSWAKLWSAAAPAKATTTTYKGLFLGISGQNLLEDWSTSTLTLTGSSAYMYPPVYSRHGNQMAPPVYIPPVTKIGAMDPHFDLYSNHPPGSPEFGITSLYVWSRP